VAILYFGLIHASGRVAAPVTPTTTSTPDRRSPTRFGVSCLLLMAALGSAPAAAQQPADDLKRLTIEELMRVDVTTAGRREQPIGATTAAMSVITADDIRRAGVTTIADALRLADGVHVARSSNGTWNISARGFNGSTPNKLLVMVDGRTVYSPLFAGVFWNTLDYVLEDIDRIEVIRGPGTVLWGANAVNGVVNIITRHSRETQGTLVSVTAGDEDPAILQARYGGRTGPTTWRTYGKFAVRDAQRFASGLSSADDRRRGQAGFRIDRSAGDSAWLVAGDVFHSRDQLPDRPAGEFTHLAMQTRWSRELPGDSRVDVQSYYRREYRRIPEQLTHHVDVFDIDAQHATDWGSRHEVVWGGGIRVNWDQTQGGATIQFDPVDRTYPLQSLFVQDEIAIVPGHLFATLGVKYERNAFSGGEMQPNLRARLMMARNQVLWGGVSRAVRRPTRLDDDLLISDPAGALLVRGTHEFEAEKLTAIEVGYRIQPSTMLSVDATAFRHHYGDLRSQDAPATGLLPLTIGNTLEGASRGVELGVNVQPVRWWQTHAGYTWLTTAVERTPGSRDLSGGASETNDPEYFFNIRSSLDLPREVEVDAMLRRVAALPNPRVPAYTELTIRGGWHVTPQVELAITGEDLLHGQHPESGPDTPARVEWERSIRGGITLRF
jgi:iron complex outermembrane receptor protein